MSDPVFLVDALPTGTTAILDGAEGRHAATVRRLTPGELLLLSDGAGGLARCEVTTVRKESLDLAVLDVTKVPAPYPRITVVQALPKGDRGELAVEMLTEAGVDTIVPWQASRCVTRWRDARGDKALAKWRSTAREAAKQSRRAWLPEVTKPATTSDVAALLSEADRALVLHEASSVPLSTVDLSVADRPHARRPRRRPRGRRRTGRDRHVHAGRSGCRQTRRLRTPHLHRRRRRTRRRLLTHRPLVTDQTRVQLWLITLLTCDFVAHSSRESTTRLDPAS